MLRLRWRSALLDDGWLAWLLPSEPAAGETELQALREQVLRLREHLHVAEEIGRLGVWERDIRHCRARWDEHMFRFFGFDPAQGVPAMEEALQRIHPDDRERVRADYGGSMQRAGRYDGRYRVLLPHGGIALVPIPTTARPWPGPPIWRSPAPASSTPRPAIAARMAATARCSRAASPSATSTAA